MYYGAIVSVYHFSAFPIAVPTITFLLLPYWPTFILRPMLWIQKVTAFMRRLSVSKPVRLNSKAKNKKRGKSRKSPSEGESDSAQNG